MKPWTLKLRCPLASTVVGIAALAGPGAPARALEPHQLFQKVSPSVVTVVVARDRDGKEGRQFGSGVVIAPNTVITNCHVLQGGKVVVVRIGTRILTATLQFPDVERDLCQLSVPDLQAPAVELGSGSTLLVGQRVYAIGTPRQLELTLSDGLISSLREVKGSAPMIQITAPISPGSSGGGLFDTEGRLIGITTFQMKDSQNLNFAHPADWIREVPERAKEALARFAANKAAGGSASAPSQSPAIAAISPLPPSLSSPEWQTRIALLEKSRGDLTLAKAVAILLDVTGADDMRALVAHEQTVKRKDWHNAYAMGVDRKGALVWAGGYRLKTLREASQIARDQCKPDNSKSCAVVLIDGEFRESAFLEVVKQLGELDIAASRQAFLASLLKAPAESRVGIAAVAGGGTGDFHYSYGYSSIRE